jgi:DNA repair protein RadD
MQLSLHASSPRRDFPPPRPFQAATREKLRERIWQGDRRIMVCSPTGSGKTVLAMYLIDEALKKKKTAIFVADRITLIDQTAETAYSLGLTQHGIILADHWRFNAGLPFQIASAQTLARRSWPDADLIIIDEAHTQLKAVTDHIQTCRAAVIGLSATPFSPGLGKLYTNLVNAATMRELTESGVLVPMRVLPCTKVDMTGAMTADGEWTDQAAGERGMEIIGNVVQEWVTHAENRKTIVFGSTIAHCEAMVREFNNAGVMAAVFTAETTDAERNELLRDFKQTDGLLKVLISVEALAKGFDVPGVSCICDVRPLRKSLSTAMQIWGRGLSYCMSPIEGEDANDLYTRLGLLAVCRLMMNLRGVNRG